MLTKYSAGSAHRKYTKCVVAMPELDVYGRVGEFSTVQGVDCDVTTFVYACDGVSVFISLPVWEFTDTPRKAQTTVTWKNSLNSTNIPENLGFGLTIHTDTRRQQEMEVWETGEIQGQGQIV